MKKGVYKHYKGGLYELLTMAALSEDRTRAVVVYRSLENGHTWVRPLRDPQPGEDAWEDEVMWPDRVMRSRFVFERTAGSVCPHPGAGGGDDVGHMHPDALAAQSAELQAEYKYQCRKCLNRMTAPPDEWQCDCGGLVVDLSNPSDLPRNVARGIWNATIGKSVGTSAIGSSDARSDAEGDEPAGDEPDYRALLQRLVEFVRGDQDQEWCQCCRDYLSVANNVAQQAGLPDGTVCHRCDGAGKVGDWDPCRSCGGSGRHPMRELDAKRSNEARSPELVIPLSCLRDWLMLRAEAHFKNATEYAKTCGLECRAVAFETDPKGIVWQIANASQQPDVHASNEAQAITVSDHIRAAVALMRGAKRGEVQASTKVDGGWAELTLPEHRDRADLRTNNAMAAPEADRGKLIAEHAAACMRLYELSAALPEVEKLARKTPYKDERAKVEAAKARVEPLRAEIRSLGHHCDDMHVRLETMGAYGVCSDSADATDDVPSPSVPT